MTSSTRPPLGIGSAEYCAWPSASFATSLSDALQERERALALDLDLAHVGDVEQAGGGAHRLVLGDEPGVLDGHLPAGEGHHLRAALPVDVVQGCLAEIGHRRARYHTPARNGSMQARRTCLDPEGFVALACRHRGRRPTSSPAGTAWASSTPRPPCGARTTRRTRPSSAPSACAASATSSAEYKQQFWRQAPAQLVEELQTLGRSQDRLGDILIRMKRITTPQLLEALVEQRETGRKLGEILVARGLVTPRGRRTPPCAIRASPSCRTRAATSRGGQYWQQSSPDNVLDYLLALGARKRASDLSARAAGQRSRGPLSDRRFLVPRRPGAEDARAGARAGPVRDVRTGPGPPRPPADRAHLQPARRRRLRPRAADRAGPARASRPRSG